MRLLDVGRHRLPFAGEAVEHDVALGVHVVAALAMHAVGLLDAVVVFVRLEQADHLAAAEDQRLAVGPVFHCRCSPCLVSMVIGDWLAGHGHVAFADLLAGLDEAAHGAADAGAAPGEMRLDDDRRIGDDRPRRDRVLAAEARHAGEDRDADAGGDQAENAGEARRLLRRRSSPVRRSGTRRRRCGGRSAIRHWCPSPAARAARSSIVSASSRPADGGAARAPPAGGARPAATRSRSSGTSLR